MVTNHQIADFLQVLDPQSPDTYQEFREKCVSTGLLMNNQYLQGGALELFKQRNTRIMVERAIVIGTKLGNKFDNYIHYLEHVWQDNPMIMDFLQQVAVLAANTAIFSLKNVHKEIVEHKDQYGTYTLLNENQQTQITTVC
ncbi:Hypothetical_protein [Hexamita inflata]|uniref:Hypothetical_protein n=1 Tax=Hexamita inflata TaxID=28002 RepID=A0AA86TP38_9EUKA|nr:Hypothetical protein HINF_LOCUS10935 [Hexamita inflata]